jgi:hypothetical protein
MGLASLSVMAALVLTQVDPRLPLWEGVVLAGALLALHRVTGPIRSTLTPWRVSRPLRRLTWDWLPTPSYPLAEP